MGIKQSYQEVSKVILEEIVENPVNLNKVNIQTYFYDLKLKHPEKYEGLLFDTNGHEPYCEDLSSIFRDFKICGFMDLENKIISKEEIIDYLNKKDEVNSLQ